MTVVVTPALPGDQAPDVPYPHHVRSEGTLSEAIRSGLVLAAADGAHEVVVIDAGGSHDPEDLPRLLEAKGDLIVGSRFCAGGEHRGSGWRRVGSRAYGWACGLVTMCPVADWTSGYRVYRGEAIDVALGCDRAQGHAWQAAVLADVWRKGLTVTEVPIRYLPSESRLSWGRVWEAVKVWWSMWA